MLGPVMCPLARDGDFDTSRLKGNLAHYTPLVAQREEGKVSAVSTHETDLAG
jgi:hypothetical protein